MNKQQLASKIWASANKMRSKIEANEYKDYILGFIFYKFLSDKEEQLLLDDGWTDDDIKNELTENSEDKNYIQGNLGYFISYHNLFSTWISPNSTFDASQVTDALLAFERNIYTTHHKVFDKIFTTLQTGLNKLGETNGARTKAIYELLKLIKDIPTDDSQDYDVLGFIYEYLIGNFAANAGKKAGEFYTPHEVALLIAEIVSYHLRNRRTLEIYDPTSGSGSLLINIGKAAAKHLRQRDSIKYYAQELKENTFNLTRMNLVMRGVKPDNIQVRCGDTLDKDWPYFDDNDPMRTYNPLYVDAVVSNPPYSQHWENKDKETEPRYANYGIAPKGKADYAFLLHDLYHVKPDGIMAIVLPHGVLFRGKEEEQIRRNLVEKNHIDAIIGLPANIFFGTGIPTLIMILRQRRTNTDTLIIDASRLSEKVGKQNRLSASDIRRIADTYIARTSDDPTFARVVTREEIRQNGYNLNIPRYIDSAEKPEPWDIHATVFGGLPKSEIDLLSDYWQAFTNLRNSLFESSNTPYTALKQEYETILSASSDIDSWKKSYIDSIKTIPQTLHHLIIDSNWSTDKETLRETIVSDLFTRLEGKPLFDKYQAYQFLSNQWQQISIDYEMIQTEGFDATRVVEPRMVIKKKDGEEKEVQDGYQGRILPFELVQQYLLPDEYSHLQTRIAQSEDKKSELEDALQLFTEDELQDDFYDSEKQSFITKGMAAKVKEIKADLGNSKPDEDSFEEHLLNYYNLSQQLKDINKEIKSLSKMLTEKTIAKIPQLTDEEVHTLLHLKWIDPLFTALSTIPNDIIETLSDKLKKLNAKYALTLTEIESSKEATGKALSEMIDNLTGNEYDMAGLNALKEMIQGGKDE